MATASRVEGNWQTAKKTIRERNKFMFNNPLLSDVEFLPRGATDAKGVRRMNEATIPAHKYVLAIGSPVFFAMFYGELAETTDIIELPDCDSESLLELLRYLYCDEVELTGSNVMQVLYLANKYVVSSLAAECNDFLHSNLCPENVFAVLPSAVKFEDKILANKCWEIIDHEGNQAVKSEPFKCIDKALLVSVLERSTINCTEINLFKAMMEWASNECKRRGCADTGREKRNILGEEVLYLCRFPLMAQADFAKTVLDADVLNRKEIVQMFKYFGEVSDDNLCFSTATRAEKFIRRFETERYDKGWTYKSNLKDFIGFSVDQPVKVRGVTLFGSEGGTYKVKFCFKEKRSTTNLFYKNVSFVSLQMEEEEGYYGYDVMFDKPIRLSANKEYIVEALIEGPPSWHGQGGNCTQQCEGVTFTFLKESSPNCTSSSQGQFPRIIFSKT